MIKTHIVLTKAITLKRGIANNPIEDKMEYSFHPIEGKKRRTKGTKKQLGQVENKNQDRRLTPNHINKSFILNNNNNKNPTQESIYCITPFI